MKTKNNTRLVILVAIGIVLLLSILGFSLITAGVLAALVPVRSTSDQVEMIEATVPVETQIFPFSDFPGMPVSNVQVEIGLGSPIPVTVVADGEWPTLCSQLVETYIRYLPERQIHIELLADPGDASCTPDRLGLPFSFRIPLNMVEMPPGKYSVNVNGVQTDFEWEGFPTDPAGYFPELTSAEPEGLMPIHLRDARVEIGVGSPIPVEVVIGADWPNLCAQLAEVSTTITGQSVNIELLATPTDASCPPDLVGLSFGIRIPLNMVEMPAGTYTVYANGLSTSFDWPPADEPQGGIPSPLRMAYIGADGNVWLIDLPENAPTMVTNDATPLDSAGPVVVSYNEPKLSSDGRYIAYRRGIASQEINGGSMDIGLWVIDLTTKIADEIYALSPPGYSWQPGTHLLAYVPELEGPYFTLSGNTVDSTYAKGIIGYDADSGETRELVAPERGYALYGPIWSPDGRFLSFDELMYYEGRGPFAYYDFSTGTYTSWEQPLGMYSWSPDGETLAYDNLTYTPTGDERIFVRSRQSGAANKFSPDSIQGLAIQPAFSPQGDKIVYLVNSAGPDSQRFTLYVQPFPQGEPVALGEFENVYLLEWSPDGTHLYFSTGNWGEQWIAEVNLLTGKWVEFSLGMQPDIASIP